MEMTKRACDLIGANENPVCKTGLCLLDSRYRTIRQVEKFISAMGRHVTKQGTS